MANHDTHRNDEALSEAQIEKALDVLDYMNNVDITGVGRKTRRLIEARQARRRRAVLLRYGAAAAAVVALAAGGIRLYTSQRELTAPIARASEQIRLITPDGAEVVIGGNTGDSHIVTQDGTSALRTGEGLVYINEGGGTEQYCSLIVPRGNIFDITLDDGTRVWLNSDTKLRFPAAFTGGERRVGVEGEAYFDVSHDADKPFLVEAGGQTLRVLGTEFNVYAYPGEQYSYMTLVSGAVSIRVGADGTDVNLAVGRQARFEAGSAVYGLSDVDTAELTAWRDGMFVFDGITLDKVFLKLSRWYDFRYEFEDAAARDLVLRGSVPIYDDMDMVLGLIESSGRAAVEKHDNTVKIKLRK